ncbi:MAG: hypothetical protein V1851_02685 [Patescibacteria group bacterium]
MDSRFLWRNWLMIAETKDCSLRKSLISADCVNLRKLADIFPDFFLKEGEPYGKLTQTQLLFLAKEINKQEGILNMIWETSIPYKFFWFKGECFEGVRGAPRLCGEKFNHRIFGELDRFLCSIEERGNIFKYRDFDWLVLGNRFRLGDGIHPSRHSLIAVNTETLMR